MNHYKVAHPIDYRYGDKKLREIFSLDNIIKTYAKIESVVAETQAELGLIPKDAVEFIKKSAMEVRPEEVIEEEKRVNHDLVALVNVMAKKAGRWGEYIHWGLTSSDVKDTAMALLIKQALSIIEPKLKKFTVLLAKKAYEFRDLPCVGRTHGIHANIYLFGHKFAVFLDEMLRHLDRLNAAKERVLVGKLSGAVGIHTALGEMGEVIEEKALQKLGLKISEISTQIVPRDRLAELIITLSLISSTLDRFATEIRNLQRTEIGEVEEPFRKEQVGSSAMPHKRNPILSESISGLSRILRGLVTAALENIILWHERDLSNSSTERVLLPEIFLLLDEQLNKAIRILENLSVKRDKILQNIWYTRGLIFSEAIMMHLASKGYGRQKAHSLIRKIAMKAYTNNLDFKEALLSNSEIRRFLSPKEIEELFNPNRYIKVAKKRIKKLINIAEKKLGEKILS